MQASDPSPDRQAKEGDLPQTGAPDRGLSRRQRITQSSVFKQTFEKGRRYVGTYMVMWIRQDPAANLRLGVITGRVFRKAVERSRARRLLREAYRLNRFRLRPGSCDVLLVARRNILGVSTGTVEKELLVLAQKAGILENGG